MGRWSNEDSFESTSTIGINVACSWKAKAFWCISYPQFTERSILVAKNAHGGLTIHDKVHYAWYGICFFQWPHSTIASSYSHGIGLLMEYGLCKAIAITYVTQSYVLVMVEHFSKWIILMPLSSLMKDLFMFFWIECWFNLGHQLKCSQIKVGSFKEILRHCVNKLW
jgi:hypothetical protein